MRYERAFVYSASCTIEDISNSCKRHFEMYILLHEPSLLNRWVCELQMLLSSPINFSHPDYSSTFHFHPLFCSQTPNFLSMAPQQSTPAFQIFHETPTQRTQPRKGSTRSSQRSSTSRPIRRNDGQTNASPSNSTRCRALNTSSSFTLPHSSPRDTITEREVADQEAEAELNEEHEALNDIIMAIDMHGRGDIGCAYYVAREETLYFMEDIKSGGGDIVDNCECQYSVLSRVFGLLTCTQ
jgi:hypothetical protein